MQRALVALCVQALLSASIASAAGLCHSWSDGEPLGALDSRLIPEASGLAATRSGTPRLYHINDSGSGPFLFVSGLSGDGLRRLRLSGVTIFDAEALAVGTLAGQPTLIVGDIGDNMVRRRAINLLAVREQDIKADLAPVHAHVAARYPDGPHNAEGLAIGPDGTLYIFTKSWTETGRDQAPSRIYRLAPDAWTAPSARPVTLKLVGAIDFPTLATRERAPFSDVVTDAAMSADGSRFLVLTYGYAWEFALDLASGSIPPTDELERGRDYEVIRIAPVLGKETITYLPGDRSFVYGKEFKPDSRPSELIRLRCLD